MADISGSDGVDSTSSTPAPGPDPTAPAVVDDAPPGPAPADGAPPPVTPTPAPEPVAAKRPDLTGRLAALSKQSREAARAARTAEQRAKAAEAKAADWDEIAAKAATDPAAMDKAFAKLGLNFDTIVNRYADATPQLTPEQARDKAIEELRAETAAIKKQREDEVAAARNAAAQRQAESARAETLGSIAQTIAKQADKYEICARLGNEAANDVFAEVVSTWNKAGRPELMPGEFEEAVAAAIEHQELIYENRGKQLAKGQRANAATPAATAAKTGLTPKGEPLPDGLIRGALSDKDADILKGLTDKTAPAYESQRAKPRTINSSLGGSAPPRAPARGAMDPRDALREVLAPYQRQ